MNRPDTVRARAWTIPSLRAQVVSGDGGSVFEASRTLWRCSAHRHRPSQYSKKPAPRQLPEPNSLGLGVNQDCRAAARERTSFIFVQPCEPIPRRASEPVLGRLALTRCIRPSRRSSTRSWNVPLLEWPTRLGGVSGSPAHGSNTGSRIVRVSQYSAPPTRGITIRPMTVAKTASPTARRRSVIISSSFGDPSPREAAPPPRFRGAGRKHNDPIVARQTRHDRAVKEVSDRMRESAMRASRAKVKCPRKR